MRPIGSARARTCLLSGSPARPDKATGSSTRSALTTPNTATPPRSVPLIAYRSSRRLRRAGREGEIYGAERRWRHAHELGCGVAEHPVSEASPVMLVWAEISAAPTARPSGVERKQLRRSASVHLQDPASAKIARVDHDGYLGILLEDLGQSRPAAGQPPEGEVLPKEPDGLNSRACGGNASDQRLGEEDVKLEPHCDLPARPAATGARRGPRLGSIAHSLQVCPRRAQTVLHPSNVESTVT